MRNIVVAMVLLFIVACACHAPRVYMEPVADVYTAPVYDSLEGKYSGQFGNGRIYIILTHITGRHAVGYNLCKGLRRNMSGTMQQSGTGYSFRMNEPGDHPFDGKFTFTIDTVTHVMSGTWTALNNKSLATKNFRLQQVPDDADAYMDDNYLWQDSTVQFSFQKNGMCVYEFYPVVNGKSAEQMVRVKGTWLLKDSDYTVDWEPNKLFANRRSIFVHKMVKYDSTGDDAYEVIKGEGHTLSVDEGF